MLAQYLDACTMLFALSENCRVWVGDVVRLGVDRNVRCVGLGRFPIFLWHAAISHTATRGQFVATCIPTRRRLVLTKRARWVLIDDGSSKTVPML